MTPVSALALAWLNEDLEVRDEHTLIFGSNIAYYATINHAKRDFMLYNSTSDKFRFEDYKDVLYLSHIPIREEGLLELDSREISYTEGVFINMKKETYQNLYLYRIRTVEDYERFLSELKESTEGK